MKRPVLHRLFSIWLALLVLTGSVGLTVQQHTCRVSGRHTASIIFAPHEHGCPLPPVQSTAQQRATPSCNAQIQDSCCEYGAHLHKVDVPSAALAWVKAPAPHWAPLWLGSSAWPTLPTAVLRLQAAPRWHAADTSPPPRAGRTLLTFVGVLVV